MPSLSGSSAIRARLAADRAWSAYALGDLAPGLSEYAEWYAAPGDSPGLLMLFRSFATPVLFTIGPASALEGLLDEIQTEQRLYLSILPDILPLIQARYRVSELTLMWRMTLDAARFSPAPSAAVRLTLADLPAIERLFATGAVAGDAPDFFAPYMVEQGVYYGLYEADSLVATAGTHLLVPAEGVAAVGNVYTRRDRRGRGLATQVTASVVADVMQNSPTLDIIALNVKQSNDAALRVYQRLGFVRYCAFYEGMALV